MTVVAEHPSDERSGSALDAEAAWRRATETLEAVRSLAVAQSRSDLASRIDDELPSARTRRALTVVVAAETSCGKSSLVNALVSSPGLLPVDVDVATGVFAVVGYADAPSVRVFTRDGDTPIESSLDDIPEWVSVARNPDNEKGVLHVEVGIPDALLSEGVQFADTPGVGGLDSDHAAMTLTALADADALLFVLDARAPLSRPELKFLVNAAQRIQTVVFVLTKTDLNPSWRTVLDEDRQLLSQYAPRFARHRIFPVRSPDAIRAERKRRAGDERAAARLAERSGLPALRNHLRRVLIERAQSVRLANAYRLAISVLTRLDDGFRTQEQALAGNKEPLQKLQRRQHELAALREKSEGWMQHVRSAFDDLQRETSRDVQERTLAFHEQFEAEIETNWHRQRQLKFAYELEAPLRRAAVELQRRLGEQVLEIVAAEASRLGIDDVPAPEATLTLPDRETLSARSLDHLQSRNSTAVGALLLGSAAQTVRGLFVGAASPLSMLLAPLGLGSAIVSIFNARHQHAQIEKAEARRLLQEYEARFRRDAITAIDDAIRAARNEAVTALKHQIRTRHEAVRAQVELLTAEAAKVNEAEASRAQVAEHRGEIAKLLKLCQRGVAEHAPPTPSSATPERSAPAPSAAVAEGRS